MKVLADHDLLKGKTLAVDATTLEANAAMRSIVRRDTGQAYRPYLEELVRAEGIETPTKQELARLGRKRTEKASNKDWKHPQDADARITKMEDGRTCLAHKAEHTVDLGTQALVAVQVCGADAGDPESLGWSLAQADRHLQEVEQVDKKTALKEVVADKGYHSNHTMKRLKKARIRSTFRNRIAANATGRRSAPAQAAVYANRRRIRGQRGKRLRRRRAGVADRSFARAYETGGMRRVHLRGHTNISKRLCIHGGVFNLGLVMRKITGTGTSRRFHELAPVVAAWVDRLKRAWGLWVGKGWVFAAFETSFSSSLLSKGRKLRLSQLSGKMAVPLAHLEISTDC